MKEIRSVYNCKSGIRSKIVLDWPSKFQVTTRAKFNTGVVEDEPLTLNAKVYRVKKVDTPNHSEDLFEVIMEKVIDEPPGKRFTCEQCDFQTEKVSNLKRHTERKHSKEHG